MPNQLALNLENYGSTSLPSETRPFTYDPIHVTQSTFLAGISSHIHRWFRLTPSFGPDLVHEMLHSLNVEKDDYILDPFSGTGTTAIETALEGFDSLNFEINPFLHFVNRTSLNWSLNTKALKLHLSEIRNNFSKSRTKVSFETLKESGYSIPEIHNATRWWRTDVLTDLLVIKKCINKIGNSQEVDFFNLALAGILVPNLTNVTLGRLQLHFINRDDEVIDSINIYTKHAEKMIDDIELVKNINKIGKSDIFLQDSTNLSLFKCNRKVDCVITSPPYPNRYSYIWNTRPHLYLFGFLKNPKEASNIDKQTIGGTWGTATSELQKGKFPPLNEAVKESINSTVEAIRENDNLMANYAMHYFNRLTKHILELEKISSNKLRIAYVVGNSWLKGVYVETDVLLADILERLNLGYKIKQIHCFRRRHSGEKLFESIVYASKK